MSGLSRRISSRPVASLIIVLALTAFLGGAFMIEGLDMEATENTFMPETELVNASQEISRKFESIEGVQVVARADNGNVLTPETLIEILEVERAIETDSQVEPLLLSETDPRRISSVADNLIQASELLDTIRGMNETLTPQFSQMNGSLGGLLRAIRDSRIEIEESLGSSDLPASVVAASQRVMAVVMELMSLMPEDQAGDGHGQGEGEGPSARNYTKMIGFYSNMTQQELLGLVQEIMEYEGSDIDPMVNAVSSAVSTGEATLEEIELFGGVLAAASTDPNMGGSSEASQAILQLNAVMPPMRNALSEMMTETKGINIEVTAKQLNSGVTGLKRGIRFLLTTDFNPQEGEYGAESTMISFSFNASKSTVPGDDKDLLLRAEEAMQGVIESIDPSHSDMVVTAQELTSREILTATQDSLMVLLPMAFLLVIVVLALVYRNLTDMMISIVGLGISVVWTYGLGVLAGFVFNPMTLAVPVIIIGLGIDYGIHLTLRYREERNTGAAPEDASSTSITWVGSALLIATITSVLAFLANLTSDLSALQEFGILSGMGIASAFVIMVIFVPSVKQILDRRSRAKQKARGPGALTSFGSSVLSGGATAAQHHPKVVILFTVLVTLGALYGASQLETRFEIEDFLPEDLEYSRNLRYILDNFNVSSASASILVEGNISSPQVLKAMDVTTLNMMDDEMVSKRSTAKGDRPEVTSILSLMKDVADDERIADPLDTYDRNFSLMYEAALVDGDEVPDRGVGDLLLWLYRDDLTKSMARSLIHRNENGEFDATVMRIGIESDRREDADQLMRELEQDATPLDELAESEIVERATVTGSSIMLRQITASMESSMTLSFFLTLALSFIVLTIIFAVKDDSLVLGAITMVPVLLCSAWILGTMYIAGIPYTMLTITVTALTIGLGVTYGIHLTHRFVEEVDATDDVDEGCREAVIHTGSALFGAAATTVSGFGLLIFSFLPPLKEFGGIVALTIIYSFLSAVFILPTFLVLWAKRFRKPRGD